MKQDRNSRLANWILVINLLVMLFPPIHLWFSNGSVARAMTYFLGSGIFLVASMMVLQAIDNGEEE